MINFDFIAGCVLAGGRSERFEGDKRFYKLKGKALIEISLEKLRKFFDRIYIICEDKNFMEDKLRAINSDFRLYIIEDVARYKGPLMGIYSFFKKTFLKSGFFIPCDMPYLPFEFIKYLKDISEKFNFQKIILISEERPLPIFINSFFLLELENYLRNQNSMKGFIKLLKEKYPDKIYFIPEEELFSFGNPEIYMKNINKREDLNDT